MAAKSKQRNENKLLKLEKLQLKDLVCSICQSILIEPVTLPCYHYFCQKCFNGSVENNALCCPLCRLRIGSWLRTATKQKNIVNSELWTYIKSKFSQEIDNKLRGEDLNLPQEKPTLRLSAPGEIRSEYEAELDRLRAERIRLEQKHFHETETLIKKIQQEENEAQKNYLNRLKQDELLARKLQKEQMKDSNNVKTHRKKFSKAPSKKPNLKPTTIDSYLSKKPSSTVHHSALLTDDNTSSDISTPATIIVKYNRSPEIVPSYEKAIKNFTSTNNTIHIKEESDKEQISCSHPLEQEPEKTNGKNKVKTKNGINSVLVSLQLPFGVPQPKKNFLENRHFTTDSVDSMHQELCYFKPIEKTAPLSSSISKGLPVRVPSRRAGPELNSPAQRQTPPTRAQYIEGLCKLRNLSLNNNLPSAFVLALNILRAKKENPPKYTTNNRIPTKRTAPSEEIQPIKKNIPNRNKQTARVNGITKLNNEPCPRRTRSMGSLKEENETTPKKVKIDERKAASERKPYLRSDSRKLDAKRRLNPTLLYPDKSNGDVNLVVNNLSSPLKKLLQEQFRIEKIIQQEKNDFELAQKVEAEWNGQRHLRRNAAKRQVTINYALRPAKKLKV